MFEEGYLIENKYKVVEKIGRGGFGNVYLVTDTSPSRKRYALKVLEDVKMNEELKVGLVLGDKSPFLVKFLEVINQKGRLMILMEYCSEGDLAKRINKEHPPSDIDIYRFIYESGMGLKTLHNAKIVHRDIKPSNFFLGEDGGLKLGDYGMAMALETLLGKSSFTAATNGYTAPEILMGKKVCTLKVDIFSLGVTLMEFILGHNPFSNPGENVNMMLALTGKPVDAALTHPHPAMELARRMIAVDPEARPTIDAVLSFSLPLTPLHALCVQALKDKKRELAWAAAEAERWAAEAAATATTREAAAAAEARELRERLAEAERRWWRWRRRDTENEELNATKEELKATKKELEELKKK